MVQLFLSWGNMKINTDNRHQAVLESLNKCARAFLESRDFTNASHIVYETCKKLIGATAGYVALLSKDKTLNEVLFLDMGGLPCDVDPDLPMPIRGLRAEAYSTGRVVYENNFQQSEWIQYLPEGHGRLNNVLFAPLVINDKTLGVFGFANKPGGFDRDDIIVVKAFAELAAVGLMQSRTMQDLEASETRMREIFKMMEGGGGVYKAVDDGEDFIILEYHRPSHWQDFNGTAGDLTGKSLLEVFPSSKEYGLLSVFQRVWQTEKPEHHPVTIYEGDEIKSWRKNYVFKLSSGEIISLYYDITERKRMEKKLLESENLFRSIFDTSPDPININRLDDGRFVLVNRNFLAFTGYTKSEVIGKTALDIKIWKDVNKRAEFFDQLLEHWQVDDFEAEFRCKDGTILTALVSAKLLPYQNHPHLLAVTKDITELKKAEQGLMKANKELAKRYRLSSDRLKESEIKYSALIEALLTGVYMCEGDRIVFVNNQFKEMLGYEKDELLNLNLSDLIHPDDREHFKTFCSIPASAEPDDNEFEIRGIRKNGEIIYLAGRNSVVKFDGKEGILGNVTNITSRKMAEKELRKSEEELRFLSNQLLSAEERERKRIAGDIHDSIGQVLSAIKFSVESSLYAIAEQSYTSAQESLEKIIPLTQQSIEEVRRIIMDLRPSMLDDLGLIATISWFCREFESVYTNVTVEKDIDAQEDDIPPSLKIVIYRIMQEALNNAAKYSQNDSIKVYLTKSTGSLELAIEDQGIGFDIKTVRSRISNRTGMGLSSMKERAQLSGGTFTIESSPETGTRIHVIWPLAAPAVIH